MSWFHRIREGAGRLTGAVAERAKKVPTAIKVRFVTEPRERRERVRRIKTSIQREAREPFRAYSERDEARREQMRLGNKGFKTALHTYKGEGGKQYEVEIVGEPPRLSRHEIKQEERVLKAIDIKVKQLARAEQDEQQRQAYIKHSADWEKEQSKERKKEVKRVQAEAEALKKERGEIATKEWEERRRLSVDVDAYLQKINAIDKKRDAYWKRKKAEAISQARPAMHTAPTSAPLPTAPQEAITVGGAQMPKQRKKPAGKQQEIVSEQREGREEQVKETPASKKKGKVKTEKAEKAIPEKKEKAKEEKSKGGGDKESRLAELEAKIRKGKGGDKLSERQVKERAGWAYDEETVKPPKSVEAPTQGTTWTTDKKKWTPAQKRAYDEFKKDPERAFTAATHGKIGLAIEAIKDLKKEGGLNKKQIKAWEKEEAKQKKAQAEKTEARKEEQAKADAIAEANAEAEKPKGKQAKAKEEKNKQIKQGTSALTAEEIKHPARIIVKEFNPKAKDDTERYPDYTVGVGPWLDMPEEELKTAKQKNWKRADEALGILAERASGTKTGKMGRLAEQPTSTKKGKGKAIKTEEKSEVAVSTTAPKKFQATEMRGIPQHGQGVQPWLSMPIEEVRQKAKEGWVRAQEALKIMEKKGFKPPKVREEPVEKKEEAQEVKPAEKKVKEIKLKTEAKNPVTLSKRTVSDLKAKGLTEEQIKKLSKEEVIEALKPSAGEAKEEKPAEKKGKGKVDAVTGETEEQKAYRIANKPTEFENALIGMPNYWLQERVSTNPLAAEAYYYKTGIKLAGYEPKKKGELTPQVETKKEVVKQETPKETAKKEEPKGKAEALKDMVQSWSVEKQQAVYDYLTFPEEAKKNVKADPNAKEALQLIKDKELAGKILEGEDEARKKK